MFNLELNKYKLAIYHKTNWLNNILEVVISENGYGDITK